LTLPHIDAVPLTDRGGRKRAVGEHPYGNVSGIRHAQRVVGDSAAALQHHQTILAVMGSAISSRKLRRRSFVFGIFDRFVVGSPIDLERFETKPGVNERTAEDPTP
jgi:hypothetical protein